MPRDVLIAIGGGLLSAVAAFAFFGGSAFSIFFVYFASVPLLMVGLALGPRAALIAAGAGICASGFAGGLLSAGIFGLVQALPAWVISQLVIMRNPVAEENQITGATPDPVYGYSPGLALSALALVGSLLIVITALGAGSDGLKSLVDTYLTTAFSFMAPAMGDQGKEQLVATLSTFFPGAIGASWVTMIVINAVVAQRVLTRLDKNLVLTPAYAGIDIPLWMSWPLVAAATCSLAGNILGLEGLGYAAYNVAMVIATPYFFLGLAVIHTLARRITTPGLVLVGVYAVIIISLWGAVVVAGVGIAEQWIGLRGQSKDDEDGQPPIA